MKPNNNLILRNFIIQVMVGPIFTNFNWKVIVPLCYHITYYLNNEMQGFK